MIEHLQARLRRAHQRVADAEAHSAQGQLEEQTAVLQRACERVEQLEDANSQLQACSLNSLTRYPARRQAAALLSHARMSRGLSSERHWDSTHS